MKIFQKPIVIIFLIVFNCICSAQVFAANEDTVEPPRNSFYAAYGDKAEKFQHLIGEGYKEARKEILSSGWKIFDSNLSDWDIKVAKKLWDLGYYELEACTGAGESYCSFIFINDQGEKLRIVVKGEYEPHLRVLYANILPEDYK